MTILNGFFPKEGDMREIVEGSNELTSALFESVPLTERQESIVEYLRQGLTLGNILGITPKDMNALIAQALRFIEAGRRDKARDVLLRCHQLDPLEARAVYVIGTTYQMDGDLERAAHFYMHFLALDATNPDGYLRLAECLMAAGEIDNARDAVGAAAGFARQGKGRPEALAHAERLQAAIDRMPAAAASAN